MVAKITRSIGANDIASGNGKLRSYVQANVQNRDLGGFVEVEAKLKTLDWEGMTYKMTGEYENQRRFVKTMWLVFPIVMLIIFVLLFMVFHSGMEAAHVMLAVPFALSGGVILQKLSVKAMMAELGEKFSRADLVQAVKDGAKLRLRPKVMIVATTVASLMPIMWSNRQDAEVMKPLATPVIGGMISSLIHILIVTPVVFLWLHERQLRRTRN